MKKIGMLLIGAALTLGVFAAPAFADRPPTAGPPANKAVVCKYVGTPITSEVAQTGQNPISVDSGSYAVGDQFVDAQGGSLVIAVGVTQEVAMTFTAADCPVTTPDPTIDPTIDPTVDPTPTCEETQTCETETETITTVTTPPVVTTTSVTEVPPTTSEVPTTTTTEPEDSTTSTSTAVKPAKSSGTGNGGNADAEGGKLAFTGIEDIVPLGALALGLLTGGSGLMWLGRKREEG